MPTPIRRVVISAFGDESVLRLENATLPDPGPGEARLSVELSVVAGSDVNMRRGTYPLQRKPPLTPGYTVLGTVVATGPNTTIQNGTRVVSLTKYNGQSTGINQPEKFLIPVPPAADPRQAVALPLDWMTAFQMLHRSARVRSGQRLFVHGLSGGVGVALLILGRLAGCEVFGTASTSKHDTLRQLGAIPLDYRTTDWIHTLQSLGGADAVFDPLGYKSFDQSFSILRRGGVLVGYGFNGPALTNTPRRSPLPSALKLLARNLAFWRRRRTTFYGLSRTSKHFRPDLQTLLQWLAEGRFTVPIKATLPLEEVQQAHHAYTSSPGLGSIILTIP